MHAHRFSSSSKVLISKSARYSRLPFSRGSSDSVLILKSFLLIFFNSIRSGSRQSGIGKGLSFIFIVMIFGYLVPQFLNSELTAESPRPLASSGMPVRLNGSFPTELIKALAWMKANTTQKAVVLSWWDYGYWIETMANRTTIIDCYTQNCLQHWADVFSSCGVHSYCV